MKTTKKKSNRNPLVPEYEHNIGDLVIYIGNLYESLKGLEAEVVTRSRKKNKIDYIVEFVVDGNVKIRKTMIASVLIPKCQQITIDDIAESNN